MLPAVVLLLAAGPEAAAAAAWRAAVGESATEAAFGAAASGVVAVATPYLLLLRVDNEPVSRRQHALGLEPTLVEALPNEDPLVFGSSPEWDEDFGGWVLPFTTGLVNTRLLYEIDSKIPPASLTVETTPLVLYVTDVVGTTSIAPFSTLSDDGSGLTAPTSLALSYIADRSAFWFLVPEPNEGSVLLGSPNLEDMQVLDFSATVGDTDVCGSLVSSSVVRMVALQERIVAATRAGLLEGIQDSAMGDDLAWSAVLDGDCVSSIATLPVASKFSSRSDSQIVAIVANEPRAYFSEGVADYLEVDVSSVGATRLRAAAIKRSQDKVFLLVAEDSAGNTFLIEHDVTSASTALRFEFPATLPAVDGTVQARSSLLVSGVDYTGATPAAPPTLTEMSFTQGLGLDLYVYGSALLYSPDGGFGFYVLHASADSDTQIESLAFSLTGEFVLLETTGRMLYGQVASQPLVALDALQSNFAGTAFVRLPFFSDAGQLRVVSMNATGGVLPVVKDLDLRTALRSGLFQQPLVCPYDLLEFDVPDADLFARARPSDALRLPEVTESSLPRNVFLGVNDMLEFLVTATKDDGTVIQDDLSFAFYLSNQQYVELDAQVAARTVNQLSYRVELRDQFNLTERSEPGSDLIATQLNVRAVGANFGCTDASGRPEVTKVTTVFTGCPPGRRLEIDIDDSREHADCGDKFDIPCVYYEDDFRPRLYLTDDIRGESERFLEQYTLLVVGAGPTLDSIEPIKDEDIGRFNLGGRSIWTPLSTSRNPLPANSGITWVCAPGSPCSSPDPNFPDVPEYYLRIQITNADEASYCVYQTEFTIRLHGIPMDFITTFTYTASVIGASIVLFCGGFLGAMRSTRLVSPDLT